MSGDQILIKDFADLTQYELYEILRARNEVFIVEQNCVYRDVDGHDERSLHVVIPFDGKLGAYCRVVRPGTVHPEWCIGRVLTAKHARGRKLAHRLMAAALDAMARRGGGSCRIAAQAHLQKFYASYGFARIGEDYLDDGIPHVDMLRTA